MTKKKVAGITIIILTLFLLGFWEFWGRENFMFKEVLVLRNPVSENVTITREMLTTKLIENPHRGVLYPGDIEKIENLVSKQYIPPGEVLYSEYFQEKTFSVGKETGKYILSIPNDWLRSYPQTLRRGDRAFFYCNGEIVTDAMVAYARDSSNQEVMSTDDERLTGSAEVSLIEIIVDDKQARLLGNLADKGNKFVLLYR